MSLLQALRHCQFQTSVHHVLILRRFAGVTQLEPIVLRPYQDTCLQACLDALGKGIRRIGVSMPTGAGKTTVFVSLISQIPPRGADQRAKRALIIVNSIELARQSAAQVERLFPELSVEIEQGTKHNASGVADVTVATYQTLLQAPRLAKFDPNFLKVVVVDEAHHAAAPSYRRILGHFDPSVGTEITIPPSQQERLTSIPIIGFSATFGRHDGLSLGSVFEEIVYHRDFLQMIREQWLCNVRFTSVRAQIDLSQVTVNTRTGDFNASSLAHVVNTQTVNKLVVQTWLDRAAARKSTLVFCANLAHVRDLTNAFRSAGVDARYLHSGTPAAERKALIYAFKRNDFPLLVNCAILTEGADIPNIDCVVVVRPTRSRNVFTQMIGRGMRLSPNTGKTDCRIIDFVDSNARVSGIVSTPTLFGLEPEDEIEDETMDSLEERAERLITDAPIPGFSTSDVPDPTSVTYIDYDNPFSLVCEASGSPHIATLSSNAWVACGGDIYVLECVGRGYIRVESLPENDHNNGQPAFQAFYTPAMPDREVVTPMMLLRSAPYRQKKRILTAQNLGDAIRGCDTYAREKVMFGTLSLSLFRTAKWRKALASPSQKQFIAKRLGLTTKREVVANSKLDFDRLTKGEAANIITRLRHGAQARYKKKLKEASKVTRAMEKESKRRAREQVRVGPFKT